MILYAMLYASVAGLPILAAAALEAAFLRRYGRAERWVWLAAVVLVLALPLAVFVRPVVPVPAAVVPTVVTTVSGELRPVLVLPTVVQSGPDLDLAAVVVAFWLAVSAGLAIRWSMSWARLREEREWWRRQRLDGVPVSVSTDVGPGVFGLLQPQVVVPSWVIELPADRRAFILRHEQEHLKSRDHWLGALIRLARILAPWNPIVWVMTSKLGNAVELDCDRRVLRTHPDVAGYGATLLLVSERRSQRLIPVTAFAASDATLRQRILAMTAPQRTLSAVAITVAIAAGGMLLMGALRVPVPAHGASSPRLEGVLASAPPLQRTSEASPLSQRIAGAAEPRLGEPSLVQPQPLRPLNPSSAQVRQPTLPEPQLIVHRDRVLFLAPDTLRGERLRQVGYTVVADGVRVVVAPGAEAAQFFRNERLVLFDLGPSSLAANVINPIAAPFPGGPPREITETPQILNPEEILAEITAAYPPSLRERGLGGTVGVQFLVGEAGEVRNVRVSAIAAYDELTIAAGRVAQVYRFSPARAGDEYLAVWVSHAIDFRVP